MESAVPDIRELLAGHRALLDEARSAGAPVGDDLDELAARWAALGCSSADVAAWLKARCASPAAAELLGNLSVSLAAAARPARAVGLSDTLAFLVAAGRLTDPAGILVAAGVSTLLLDEPTARRRDAGDNRAVELAMAATTALRELALLLDEPVAPAAVNELAYRLVETIRYTAMGVEKLGTRSIGPSADYLEYNPPNASGSDRDGARDLAARLEAFSVGGYQLYRRGREDFFGYEAFNPSGFTIRMAIKDGRRVAEVLDDPEQ